MELTVEQALAQGIEAHKEGKLQEAEKLYRAIIKSQPNHSDANHNLGVLAVSLGKLEAAIPHFKVAIEANPNFEQYWVSCIETLIKLGQREAAKDVLKQGKSIGLKGDKVDQLDQQLNLKSQSGSSPQSQIAQLVHLYGQQQFNEALIEGNALSLQFPSNPQIPNIIGAINAALGKNDEAIASYQKAIELDPTLAEAHNNLGVLLKGVNQHTKAVTCFDNAVEAKADFIEAYNSRANTLIILEEIDRAVIDFTKVLVLNPGYINAYLHLANALTRTMKHANAIVNYNRTLCLKPDYYEAYSNLGNALNKTNDYEQSICSLKKALVLSANPVDAYLNLGTTCKALKRFECAVINYKKAIQISPNDIRVLNNLGTVLEKQKQYDAAINQYKRALELNPVFSEARNNLGDALRRLNKHKEAILHYDYLSDTESQAKALECFFSSKDYEGFNKRLNYLTKENHNGRRIAAISAFAAHQLQQDDPYPFCKNPIDYVSISNLANYDPDIEPIIKGIMEEVKTELAIWEPDNKTTKLGFQTISNIFDSGQNCVALEKILREEILSYHSRFKSNECDFIMKWPEDFNLVGWFVRLLKNGYQNAHIHPGGWLSGVVYLQPIEFSDDDEGAIEFGLHGYKLPILDESYPRLIYQPQKGDIILFPSSLFHKTIPFKTDVERSIIAFDLIAS